MDYVMFIRECVGLKNLQSAVRAACYKVWYTCCFRFDGARVGLGHGPVLRRGVVYVQLCASPSHCHLSAPAHRAQALLDHGLFDIFPLTLRSQNARMRNAATEVSGGMWSCFGFRFL